MIHDYMVVAYSLASQSPDKSNQNGAVVTNGNTIMSLGYNHFYLGIPPTDERPAKYERIVHAEADACLKLANCSLPVGPDTVMICPWAACKACAMAIIGSGIKRLVVHEERNKAFLSTRAGQNETSLKDWKLDEPMQWLKDAGCKVEYFSGPVGYNGTININGFRWDPKTLEFV